MTICCRAVSQPASRSAQRGERRLITGAQIKKARKLLGWRQAELAKQARIPTHSVESAESSIGASFVPGQDLQSMQVALEAAGIEFTDAMSPA
jgi:hypothetical protein